MLSLNSLKNFFAVNCSMIVLSLIHFTLTIPTDNLLSDILNQVATSLVKNYVLLDFIEYRTSSKKKIMDQKRELVESIPKEIFYKEFDLFVLVITIFESITNLIVKNYLITDFVSINLYDLVEFFFISFVFEILFDFFHYFTHFYFHRFPLLYRNFHKVHHKWTYPTPILTFYQHPVDYIFTNSIPTFLTMYILYSFKITYFQYELIQTYKTLLEIAGHSGKKVKSSSFTQCIWLPKLFNFQIKVQDHDLHHTMNNCNYAKRFSLWDKLFGTYIDYNNFE